MEFNELAFAGELKPPRVAVRTTEHAGNGTFAAAFFDRGDVIYTETPLVVAAELDSVAHCDFCLASLAPAECILGLPHADVWPTHPLQETCEQCQRVHWCNKYCRRKAAGYHARMCWKDVDNTVKDGAASAVSSSSTLTTLLSPMGALIAMCRDVPDFFQSCAHFPLLVLRVAASTFAMKAQTTSTTCTSANLKASTSTTADTPHDDQQSLNDVFDAHYGPLRFCRLLEHQMPMIDYLGFSRAIIAVLQPMGDELAWLTLDVIKDIFSFVCPNVIRVRPQSPFHAYMRALRSTKSEAERAHAVAALRSSAGDNISAGQVDEYYRGLCGSEGAGLYLLQSKCNHDCDPNAECNGYMFHDATLDVVAKRGISPGEQVRISYVDTRLKRDARRKQLRSSYYFNCECERCMDHHSDATDSTVRSATTIAASAAAAAAAAAAIAEDAEIEEASVAICGLFDGIS